MRRQGRTGGFRPLPDKPHISALFARAGEPITHSRLLPHHALYSALRSVYSELIDVSQAPASSPAPRRRSRAKDPTHLRQPQPVRAGPHPPRNPGRGPAAGGGDPRRPTAPCRPAAPGGSEGGTAVRGGRAVVNTQVPPGRVAGRQPRGPRRPRFLHPGGRSLTTGAGSPHLAPPPQDRDGRARPKVPRTGTRGPGTPHSAPGTPRSGRRRQPRPSRHARDLGGAGPISRPAPQPRDPTRQHPTGTDDMETGGTSDR